MRLVKAFALTRGQPSKRQLWNSLRWEIYVINSVDHTKLPCNSIPPTWQHCFFRNLPLCLTGKSMVCYRRRNACLRPLSVLLPFRLLLDAFLPVIHTKLLGSDSAGRTICDRLALLERLSIELKTGEARENASNQVAIGFSFISDWLGGLHEFSGPITEKSWIKLPDFL